MNKLLIGTNLPHVFKNSVSQNDKETKLPQVEENESDKKLSKGAKIAIMAGTFAALAGVFIYAGKTHKLGDGVYNFLNGNKNKVNVSYTKDNLPYEILAPRVDNTPFNPNDFLDCKYEEVMKYTLDNGNTQKRYEEVRNGIITNFEEIRKKVNETTGIELYNMDENCAKRLISQKRYFSIPENQAPNYCCKDPLLYQKAREEAVDIFFGYQVLEELNFNQESTLLNALRRNHSSVISNADNSFLNSCINKLQGDSICHGKHSAVHAYELSHVGKIFREAMGIVVQ